MRTDSNGNQVASFTSLPYGDAQTQTTYKGGDLDQNHFAQLDFDTETDTDHAQFRQYSSTEGRWLSPDPWAGSYRMGNPQSMNRYVYAMNSPLSKTDPSGQGPCDELGFCFGYDNGGGGSGGGSGGGMSFSCFTMIDGYGTGYEDGNENFFPYPFCFNNGSNGSWGGPGGSGGAGGGGTNIYGVTKQQEQDCLNAWSNSTAGKATQFFSILNLANNLKSLTTWAEWTAVPYLKVQAVNALSKISSAIGGTELTSAVTGTTTTVTTAPVASAISSAEPVVAEAAPYAIVAATAIDLNVSASCAGDTIPLQATTSF